MKNNIIVTQDQINIIRKELSLPIEIEDITINEFIVYDDPFNPEFPWSMLSDEFDDFLSK
jgi:hypothetical protein